MLRKIIFNIFFVICALAWGANSIYAQGTTGQISGTVTDQTGAIGQGASVAVTNQETGLSRATTTTGDGIYSFQQLPPGRYKVEVTASGFQKSEAEAVVNITQTTTLDVQLGVTGGTSNVTVEA